LLAEAQETRELADGYAFRFAGSPALAARLLALIISERACCPFFSFALRWEPPHDSVWLELRGPDGVKVFLGQLAPAASA
jgi:hypothetical protein